MAYKFYIAGKQIPVPPSEFQTKINNKNERIVLADGGEINIIKERGLKDFSFTISLPAVSYPFAEYPNKYNGEDVTPPIEYLKLFQMLKSEKLPFQLDVYRELPSGEDTYYTNETVTLEDYTVIESAENGFDVDVQLNFSEYRQYGTQTVVLNSDGLTYSVVRADSKRIMRTATAKDGQTLYDVACEQFGAENVSNDTVKYLNEINNLSKTIIIDNPEEWQEDEYVKKGNFVALIDKTFGAGYTKRDGVLPGKHWAETYVLDLYFKKYIADTEFWYKNLEYLISCDYVLALCDKVSDGCYYSGRTDVDNWARNHLDSLCDKEIIKEPSKWTDFTAPVRNQDVKALIQATLESYAVRDNLYEGQTIRLTDDSYGSYSEWKLGS